MTWCFLDRPDSGEKRKCNVIQMSRLFAVKVGHMHRLPCGGVIVAAGLLFDSGSDCQLRA
jgi:hypothetical protein